MKPYPSTPHPSHTAPSGVPPEAGNVWFADATGAGHAPTSTEPEDPTSYWPESRGQMLAFWAALIFVCLVVIGACAIAVAASDGMSLGDILRAAGSLLVGGV